MDLSEWLWRNRLKQKDLAELLNLQPHTISSMVNKKLTPSLPNAYRVYKLTDGEVDYFDMMSDHHKKKIAEKESLI